MPQKYWTVVISHQNHSQLVTDAIQSKIDECSRAGGGTVLFPAGRYQSGELVLRSNVTLQLDAGAELLGSENVADYPHGYLIYAEHESNVGINGTGIINGNGNRYWQLGNDIYPKEKWRLGWGEVAAHYARTRERPNGLIGLVACKEIIMQDVRLFNSPRWTLHLQSCHQVRCAGLMIHSENYAPNVDGIDIDGSQSVFIDNCDITTGDDAIVLKTTGLNEHHSRVENVMITNCHLSTPCNGFKIGTETHQDIQQVVVNNVIIETTHANKYYEKVSAGIALESVDGADVHHISISNVTMINVRCPVFMRLGGRTQPTGKLHNIMLSNITADADRPIVISGIPGHPITDVVINAFQLNLNLKTGPTSLPNNPAEAIKDYPTPMMFGRFLPAQAFFIRHVRRLAASTVLIQKTGEDKRSATFILDGEKVTGLPK